MSWRDRTADEVILVLIVVLVAGALLVGGTGGSSGGSGGSSRGDAGSVTPQRIAKIERRVERLRGLRFERAVPVAVVSPAQARRDGLADADRVEPVAERRAGEELLKLLGLLPPDADVREIEAAVFGEQVAGYYDPRRGRLALVKGVGVDDVTLAHELTHALEDQHFDLERLGDGSGGDDASTAEQALVEGTATLVMERYTARWPSDAPVGDALAGLAQFTNGTPLPPYTLRTLLFPYLQGEQFVQVLRDVSGGDWRLVNVALRDRPPATTAEILDAERWLRAERPAAVTLGGAAALSAEGDWRRIAGSTLGAEDLAALLAPQSGPLAARKLTAGWRGGRYALWRRGPLVDPDCAAPCRRRDAFAMAVRMRTAAQARALAATLRTWIASLPAGSKGVVRVDVDSGAGRGGPIVRAALAATRELAAQLAN